LAVERSREEVRQAQDTMRSKSGHIENLERNLQELQQQQAVLQLVLDDKQNVITSLQESLGKEQLKTKDLEARLVVNNQLISKIYGDLAKSLNNGNNGTSPNGVKLNGSNGTSSISVDRNGLNLTGSHS
jgi:chromosome segregation ATPase